MQVFYCAQCHTKIAEDECVNAGDLVLCKNCAPDQGGKMPAARRVAPGRARVRPQSTPSRFALWAGSACVALLGAGLLALSIFGKPSSAPPPSVNTPEPPLPPAAPAAAQSTGQPVSAAPEVKRPVTRAADPDIADIRGAHAQKLFEAAAAWYRGNSSDPYTYRKKLNELAESYGATQAGKDAKAVLANLTVDDPRGESIWLSELDLSKVRQSYARPVANLSVDGHTLTIAGQKYEKGIGAHAISELWIDLKGCGKKLFAETGVDEELGKGINAGSVQFIISGDGKELWKSAVLRGGDAAAKVSLDLSGIKILQLLVSDAGDGNTSDHGDWADARILYSGDKPESIAAKK